MTTINIPNQSKCQSIADSLARPSQLQEGRWFAAAKSAKLYVEAITLANRTPCPPKTLTRAARHFAAGCPEVRTRGGHHRAAVPFISMLKQDYILRMIELMTRAITRLLARVKTEDPAVVHQELSDALKELTGLDFDVLDSLPLPSILEILNAHDEPDPARTLAIAECSFVRARLADGAGQEDTAHKARVLALTMYLESLALIRHEAVAQAENRAEELIKDLKTVDLPRETTLRLFRYRAIAGHFAAAEDALFDLLEITPNDAAVIDEGRAFYRRLLGLDDDELDRGHLPRSEVIESLAELEEIAGK